MDLQSLLLNFVNYMWEGPMFFYFCGVGVFLTITLTFIQFRGLWTGIKYSLLPSDSSTDVKRGSDLSPFQAFLNTLSTSLGNGSLAGMAIAIASGGPGAAFWVIIAGFIMMIIKYAEVYLGSFFIGKDELGGGGPTAYLNKVPGKKYLPYLFSVLCLFYGLASGNAMQCNSIKLAVSKVFHINNPYIIGFFIVLFLLYVVMGGAKRIISISDTIVPIKVGVFFVSAIVLLCYHYSSLLPALKLIFISAFSAKALAGGAVGVTMQRAIQMAFTKSINATEAGLGIGAVFFGAAGKKEPVRNGLMSMFGTFISNYLVCFLTALCIIVSGTWASGLTSTELTISAFESAYGVFGAWIVTFCTLSFGIGVLVAYAYVARECWLFLTSERFVLAFNIIYCSVAFLGTIAAVPIVWAICDIVNIGLLIINLFGIIWLLPVLRRGTKEFLAK